MNRVVPAMLPMLLATMPEPGMTKKVDLSVQLQFVGDESPVTMATIDVCAKVDIDSGGIAAGGVRFESTNADAKSLEFYLVNQLDSTISHAQSAPTPV